MRGRKAEKKRKKKGEKEKKRESREKGLVCLLRCECGWDGGPWDGCHGTFEASTYTCCGNWELGIGNLELGIEVGEMENT